MLWGEGTYSDTFSFSMYFFFFKYIWKKSVKKRKRKRKWKREMCFTTCTVHVCASFPPEHARLSTWKFGKLSLMSENFMKIFGSVFGRQSPIWDINFLYLHLLKMDYLCSKKNMIGEFLMRPYPFQLSTLIHCLLLFEKHLLLRSTH